MVAALSLGGFREQTLADLEYRHVKQDLEAGVIPMHVHVEADITRGTTLTSTPSSATMQSDTSENISTQEEKEYGFQAHCESTGLRLSRKKYVTTRLF